MINNGTNRVIIGELLARSAIDDQLRTRLLKASKQVLKEEGVEIPDTTNIKVVANDEEVSYVVLPPPKSGFNYQKEVNTILDQIEGASVGKEVRIVQNHVNLFYLVIPTGVPPEVTLNNVEMQLIAGGTNGPVLKPSDVVRVATNVSISVEAVALTLVVSVSVVVAVAVIAGTAPPTRPIQN